MTYRVPFNLTELRLQIDEMPKRFNDNRGLPEPPLSLLAKRSHLRAGGLLGGILLPRSDIDSRCVEFNLPPVAKRSHLTLLVRLLAAVWLFYPLARNCECESIARTMAGGGRMWRKSAGRQPYDYLVFSHCIDFAYGSLDFCVVWT